MAAPKFPDTVYKLENPTLEDNNVVLIQVALASRGLLNRTDITGKYDTATESAVKSLQEQNELSADGVVNENTWNLLFNYLEDNDNEEISEADDYLLNTLAQNNNDSFFDKDKKQTLRKNNSTIKITYGNNTMTKTIDNVIFRSKSHTIYSDGTPIADVYEFIGRDLQESQEEE